MQYSKSVRQRALHVMMMMMMILNEEEEEEEISLLNWPHKSVSEDDFISSLQPVLVVPPSLYLKRARA